MDAVTVVPEPTNEPVHGYAPGSPERTRLLGKLAELSADPIDVSHVIGGAHLHGEGDRVDIVQPHNHASVLGTLRNATVADAAAAVDAATAAAPAWRDMPFDARAAILLRAADLMSGPWRETIAAATMLGQSKSVQQAEIDAPCELVDFWRFNVHFARELLAEQPTVVAGRVEPDGLPSARRIRVRRDAVQLHGDRRQPAHRTRAHGQHRRLEALAHADPGRLLDDARARGGRACRPG